MKKIIIGLAVLALIVFGGYKLLNNISSGDAITKSVQFDYENVQQYDGTKAYVEVNGNKPYFTEKELTKKAYVKYAALDTLKRVSSTMGCIGTETMPEEDEKKDGLGDNYPTGWNSEKYDCIDGDGYSQKRTSCIARFLSGAYTEKRNIIAASPFMSNNMNVYEVIIARYIERTSNHVMLRVTPIYKSDELMCRGVLMEAYSVEDDGAGICFNVFLYNAQPGISFDYSTGKSTYTGEYLNLAKVTRDYQYIINNGTMTIHRPDCENADKIGSRNILYSNAEKEELIGAGYTAAECCNP